MMKRQKNRNNSAPNAPAQSFALEEAVLALRHADEVARFLTDLCTPAEIEAFQQRWAIAQLLDQGVAQREAAEKTAASVTTVTRVARFLQHERHCGYRLVLDRLRKNSKR